MSAIEFGPTSDCVLRLVIVKFKSRKSLLAALGVAALAGVWIQQSGFSTFVDVRDSWREESRLAREVEELEGENAALADEVEALRQNGEAIERVAREKLGLAREGEIVVEVPNKK